MMEPHSDLGSQVLMNSLDHGGAGWSHNIPQSGSSGAAAGHVPGN